MQNLFLFVVLLLSHRVCGHPLIQDRIVGGENSEKGQWPWQVIIQEGDRYPCGGSLIDKSWVLLAAHCFEMSMDPSTYKVYLGVYQLTDLNASQVESRDVKKIIIHPDFIVEGSSGDIALIELSELVEFTTYILPISLPSQKVHLPEGTLCSATGWGNTEETVPLEDPQTLQEVEVPLIDSSKCEAMFRDSMGYGTTFTLILPDMLCAGYKDGKKDACQGDSGGSLACNVDGVWLQLGVTSWGIGCANPERPGVYTRVQNYLSWLQKYVPSLQYSDGGKADLQSNATSQVLNGTKSGNLTLHADFPGIGALLASGSSSHFCSMTIAVVIFSFLIHL
ncbi:serine protease 27-like [Hyperolius riggenbachi]|uniref:serine protease 27-like n=1 Tax=Hyperolius riggenbachi TaxID=752182 RepID=UPI0035A26F41